MSRKKNGTGQSWEFVAEFPENEKGTYGRRIAESKWQSNMYASAASPPTNSGPNRTSSSPIRRPSSSPGYFKVDGGGGKRMLPSTRPSPQQRLSSPVIETSYNMEWTNYTDPSQIQRSPSPKRRKRQLSSSNDNPKLNTPNITKSSPSPINSMPMRSNEIPKYKRPNSSPEMNQVTPSNDSPSSSSPSFYDISQHGPLQLSPNHYQPFSVPTQRQQSGPYPSRAPQRYERPQAIGVTPSYHGNNRYHPNPQQYPNVMPSSPLRMSNSHYPQISPSSYSESTLQQPGSRRSYEGIMHNNYGSPMNQYDDMNSPQFMVDSFSPTGSPSMFSNEVSSGHLSCPPFNYTPNWQQNMQSQGESNEPPLLQRRYNV